MMANSDLTSENNSSLAQTEKKLVKKMNSGYEELDEKIQIQEKQTKKKIYPISGYTKTGIDLVLKKTLEAVKAWRNDDKDFLI